MENHKMLGAQEALVGGDGSGLTGAAGSDTMSSEINKRDGAGINIHDSNFKDWPEKPSGIAAKSERLSGHKLDAAARQLPEVVLYEPIDFGGAE